MLFNAVKSGSKMKIRLKRDPLGQKEHYKSLRIAVIYAPEFLEFMAMFCLPCLVLRKWASLLNTQRTI